MLKASIRNGWCFYYANLEGGKMERQNNTGLTLDSLFSGFGGFELGGVLTEIISL